MKLLNKILPILNVTAQVPNATYFALALGSSTIQQAYRTIEELDLFGRALSLSGEDTYMALASYKGETMKRTKEQVYELKSLWADIDVGKPSSKYQTIQEASSALEQFMKDTCFVPTDIVRSGMGLHVYWAFTHNVTVDTWGTLATKFLALCNQQGLDVDTTRALDTASVLRIPGTLHTKSGNIVSHIVDNDNLYDPNIVNQLFDLLIRDKSTIPSMGVANKPAMKLDAKTVELAKLLGMYDEPTNNGTKVINNCEQIRTMGMGFYPQWFTAMAVLKCCANGRELAHQLSSVDATRYDPAVVDKYYDQCMDGSPTTCMSFYGNNPQACDRCKHKGTIKSPIQLHTFSEVEEIVIEPQAPVAQPVQTTPIEPTEQTTPTQTPAIVQELDMTIKEDTHLLAIQSTTFEICDDGIIYNERVFDKQTGTFTVVRNVLTSSRLYYKHSIVRYVDEQPKRCHMFYAMHANGACEDLLFDIDVDFTANKITQWFANGRIYLNDIKYQGKTLMDFMNTYLHSMGFSRQERNTVDKFGWTKVDDPSNKGAKKHGFVTGAGIVTDTGLVPTHFGDNLKLHKTKEFASAGTLQGWLPVPQMYKTLKQEIGQLTMCLAFAAPLMEYASGEAKNALLSIWSPSSGLGKSQLLRAVGSVWGNPSEQFFSRQESVVARCRRLAIWNNLPACMDEMSDVSDEDMYNLAYTIAGGKEKNKLRSTGDKFIDTGSWSTVTFTTANRSFKEAIAKRAGDSEATLLRVMEYKCNFPSYEHRPEVQRYIEACMKACSENYGLAGSEFMYQLLKRPDRLDSLTAQVEHWSNKNKLQNKERFMSYALALAMMAGRWAVEFGLLDYDMDALERWVLTIFVQHNRYNTTANFMEPTTAMLNYLEQRQSNTLVVESAKRGKNQPDPKISGALDKYVIHRPSRDIRIRLEQQNQVMLISRQDFSDWCTNNHISISAILDDLGKVGVSVKEQRLTLTSGISYIPPVRCNCLVLDKTALLMCGYEVPTLVSPPAGYGSINSSKIDVNKLLEMLRRDM